MPDITIGQSKMVSQCAVGAICRAGDECFVVCDTTRWVNKNGQPIGKKIPIVRQHLKKQLESNGFENVKLITPPVLRSTPDGRTVGDRIPTMRFPSWMVCLKCKKLHYKPWNKKLPNGEYIKSVSELKCDNYDNKCKGRLEYVPYVLVHEKGYLDDIPWGYLSHRKIEQNNRCEYKNLLYFERNKISTRLQIRCGHCKNVEDIDGLKGTGFFAWHQKMNKQPWYKKLVELQTPPRALTITDANIHITPLVSALDIPPESDIPDDNIHCKLQNHENFSEIEKYENENQFLLLQNVLNGIARDFNCQSIEVQQAYQELQQGWPNLENNNDENIDDEYMRFKEFEVLITPREFAKYARFVTHHITDEWNGYIENKENKLCDIIDNLVIVEKLKEIQVFTGFNRYQQNDNNLISPNLGTAESNEWLPACEFYGEGLFFNLKEEILQKWENQEWIDERAEITEARKQDSNFQYLPIATPRFLLLHTLSHLLIRELEFSCGYPVSSLNEKIFCSCNDDTQMNGILIYLAVPSKLGSLGGLIDQCKPEMFYRLWHRALEKSKMCSYDPICGEHEGQGVAQLNRAACHGCLLLPEITCESRNSLLDRQFLIDKNYGLIKYLEDL